MNIFFISKKGKIKYEKLYYNKRFSHQKNLVKNNHY
jgi:hypothetical protein